MDILKIQDIDLRDKKVFAKFDLNVPFDKNGYISDYTKVNAALETIEYLLKNNCSVIIASHLSNVELSLKPVHRVLRALLRRPVVFADWVCNAKVLEMAKGLDNGEVLLLENLRFDKRETENDEEFARKLASMAEVYINDGFWVIHREHASVEKITDFFPDDKKWLGFLVQKEIFYLKDIVENPKRPFVAVVGWSKVSSKLLAVKKLVARVDKIIIGWAMAFTFLKAKWFEVWKSLVEDDLIDEARGIMKNMQEQGKELVLPVDFIVSDIFWSDWNIKTVRYDEIPEGFMWLDIWEESVKLFEEKCDDAKTIFWNGPMWAYEMEEFFNGSANIANILANSSATTIVWWGDSLSIVNKLWLSRRFNLVSTWGGASLKLLEGKSLIGIEKLRKTTP